MTSPCQCCLPFTSARMIGPFSQQEEERGDQEQEQAGHGRGNGARPRLIIASTIGAVRVTQV